MKEYPPSTSPPITIVVDECAAYLVSTNGNTTTGMFRQKGTSGDGAALSVSSDNPDTLTALFDGVEKSRGTVKIAHSGYSDGSDASASGISVDLQVEGTAAHGIFVTASNGPTKGNLIVLRNNDVDDLVVKGSGRVGIGVRKGVTPAGTIEVIQRDTTAPAVVVTSGARHGTVIIVTDGEGNERFGVDADGDVAVSRLMITTEPAGSLGRGTLFVGSDGWLTFKGANGTVTKLAPP